MREYGDFIKNTYPGYWGVLKEYVNLNYKDIILLIHYLPNILTIYNINSIYIWDERIERGNVIDVHSVLNKYNSRMNILTVLQTFKMKYLSEYKEIESRSINDRKVFIQIGNRVTDWWYQLDYFMINLPVPDVKWFKNLVIKLGGVNQIRRNVLDTDMLISVAGDKLKYQTICQIMEIPYVERTQDERLQIVYDFTSIARYKVGKNKLYSALKRKLLKEERYTRLINYAEDQYYSKIIREVKNTIIEQKYNYKEYILRDIPSKSCNKLYVQLQYDKDVHPDVNVANHLMSEYLKRLGLSESYREWTYLYRTIKEKIPYKTILIRNIIKDTMEGYTKQMKELGYIALYNFEIILGYRCDNIAEEEINSQIEKNYLLDNEKYGLVQRDFFIKYFNEYVDWKQSGRSVRENVLVHSQFRYNDIGDKVQFYSAAGSSQIKQETTKGNKVMSKTQFFYTVKDFNTVEHELMQYNRNNVVIKKELVKQRIVVNTSLQTYMQLSRIVSNLNNHFSGTYYNYGLLTKTQKAELYGRLMKYIIHNEAINNDYVLLPLDYSSFDTTITKELIITTMMKFTEMTGNTDAINDVINFSEILNKTEVTYQDKNYMYKYGMLSGWKITNIVESLLNAVVSFGVCKKLGLQVIDLVTMGDDLVMVIKEPNAKEEHLNKLLRSISLEYEKIGFNVHPTKNMISYRFLEFLRNTYYNGIVQPYPLRSMISLYYRQPTSSIEVINYSSYKSNVDKMIMRTGSYSNKNHIYKKFFSMSERKNIRLYGYKFYINPKDYRLNTENKYDYITKYSEKEIREMYSFKFLKNLFPNGYDNYILHYIKYKVLSGSFPLENIVQRQDTKMKRKYYDIGLKHYIENFFTNLKSNSKFINFNLDSGNYAINEILLNILEHEKMKFCEQKEMLIYIFDRYSHITHRYKYTTSVTISMLSKKQQIIELLRSYRLTQNFSYYNNIIASRIKERLYNYLIFKYLSKRQRLTNKNKMGLLNYYLLGSYLKDYSVALLVSDKCCIQVSVNVD